ncbi:hypothetical protein M8C21_004741 [Ambrosia artemisiifolia]|uniref:Selenoprotein O n=1 Tax=Ambrosia artemisiifolia TaxID=4212 RepID=A0AAD5GB46_AMBAR|nr:hypothetical protein M8C21_004741 [Ambrosia artemisiifolia]
MLSNIIITTVSLSHTAFNHRLRLLFPYSLYKFHRNTTSSYSTNVNNNMDTTASVSSPNSVTNGSLNKQSLTQPNIIKLSLEDFNWDHSFVRELPGDPRSDVMQRQIRKTRFSTFVLRGVAFSRRFGMWAGQLGDGRAITLGELVNSNSQRWELQLKGAGKTPYSRFADGLAVLRSSIREFLCSEAIHSLGIPTTRALSLVTTGKYVMRDMFYDGNPKDEPGAVVCRVAQSFLRFGSYEIHAARGKEDLGIVKSLADYTIRHHFPHIESMSKTDSLSFSTGQEKDSAVDLTSNKYAAWVVEVAERTASLIARWQGVGFTHGVMNTDNMSVLGLTIDYGPFGFLDAFDPSFTPNTTDLPGRRYCFANQPDVGLWNIAQFISTLSSAKLINEKEADYALERYGTKFMDDYQAVMTKKLGLPKYNKQLTSKLLNNMAVDKVDYTNFFRLLSNIKADSTTPDEELLVPLEAALLDIGQERKEAWLSWVKIYIEELCRSGVPDEDRKASMNSVNPKFILRNYLCQSAIEMAEQGDFEEVRRLLKVIESPYDEQPGMEKYAQLPPTWASRPGVCMLSCSS